MTIPVLPDVLAPGLKVVFCGTAAGLKSAERGAYYAGPGNKFYDVLFEIGLTPRRLDPAEFAILPQFGIGLTDLAKHTAGADKKLHIIDFDSDALRWKININAPKAFAFNGKRAAQEFYGVSKIELGKQERRIGQTTVWVLPSTSGASNGYWDLAYWRALADFVNKGSISTPASS